MFIIGIDPHKGSHTAAAVDRHKVVIDTIRVDADRHKRARLLAWASRFEPSSWAVEGATGMGAVLAQQLVAAGEHVVDVPPKLSSRARLLESGRSDKTDPNDARSAANVVASERLAAGRVPHVHEPLVHVCGLSGVADSPHHLGHAPIRGGGAGVLFAGGCGVERSRIITGLRGRRGGSRVAGSGRAGCWGVLGGALRAMARSFMVRSPWR